MTDQPEIPPGLNWILVAHIPRRHREDTFQEAWVALLEGRNPNTAARNYIAKQRLHEQREVNFSQIKAIYRANP